MSNVLFLGWTAPKVNRERQAGELFGSVMSYFQQQQQQGHIDSFQPVLLRNHGGDLNGFFLITGSADHLHRITESDDFVKLQMQIGYCLDGFGVLDGWTGDTLMQRMQEWQQMVGSN